MERRRPFGRRAPGSVSGAATAPAAPARNETVLDHATRLDAALAPPDWGYCRAVARKHGRTFYFASQFLPPEPRRAIHAAYAFCRAADDIVDRAPSSGL